jgi:hypothetical protein
MIKGLLLLLFLLLPAMGAFAQEAPPSYIFKQTIFELKDGVVSAPLAAHHGSQPRKDPAGKPSGWTASEDGDHYSFNAEILDVEQGTLEINVVIVDKELLRNLGNDIEALFTIYDENRAPLFSVGLNDHDVTVGSYMLHPMIMEDAFGGVGFNYSPLFGGPPGTGAEIKITVTWGKKPSDDRVYVNGNLIPVKRRRGPKNLGKFPGFEPEKTFGSYMHGFTTYDGKVITPPKTFTIGLMEKVGNKRMYPPHAVAIKRVVLSNQIEFPKQ